MSNERPLQLMAIVVKNLVSTGRRYVPHSRSYTRCFTPRFWSSELRFDDNLGGAVKDKCYADKPETIDALKGNIHEAIGEIQLIAIVIKTLVSTGRRYVPHSRSYTPCFAPCFWRSHFQSQSWCRLSISELRFDTVGLLFVKCRQR